MNELRALARNQANYFRYGTTTPSGTLWAQVQQSLQWLTDTVKGLTGAGKTQSEKVGDKVKEDATYGKDRVKEEAQKASDWAREEL